MADAVDVSWCFSSTLLALAIASFPRMKPFASMLMTTSSAFRNTESPARGDLLLSLGLEIASEDVKRKVRLLPRKLKPQETVGNQEP